MSLLYPFVWLLFPLYLWCTLRCQKYPKGSYFPNLPMLLQAAGSSTDMQKYLRYLIVICILLALSSPVIKEQITWTKQQSHDIALLLDASDSMREDGRFDTAKAIIDDFVKEREGDRLSLSLFADYAYLCVPMTQERQAISTVLPYLHIGVAGKRHTALYEALYLGAGLFDTSKASSRILILLTDGLNTVSGVPLDIALRKAKKEHLKLYTIGIGDDYQEEILRKMAEETGGAFYTASNPKALSEIYQQINKLEKSTYSKQSSTYYTHLFAYPLSLALLLYLLYLWRTYHTYPRLHMLILILMLWGLSNPSYSTKAQENPIDNGTLMLALDLSDSMLAQDSYPSRKEVALHQATALIQQLPHTAIGVIGYAKIPYLITAPTRNHPALLKLLQHLNSSMIETKGTHLLEAIKAAEQLLPKREHREMILFTDGGEQQQFDREIAFAKERALPLSIYAIGTRQGTVIPDKKGFRKNANGTLILTRRNDAIATLAEKTGGTFLIHSTSSHILEDFATTIQNRKSSMILTHKMAPSQQPLFYLPLLLALLLFLSTHLINPLMRRDRSEQ